MVEALCVLAGLGVGAVLVWLLTSSRVAAAQRTASSAAGTIAELRAQIDRAEAESRGLQTALDGERQARVRAQTQFDEAARNLDEQRKLLEESKKALADTFKALSDDALKSNNQAFLDLAKKTLETQIVAGKGDMEKRQQAINELVKPLKESLAKYDEQAKAMEASRQKAYGGLSEQVKSLIETQTALRDRTDSLVTALRRPEVRGRWGENTLHRVAEMAGMVEHCDFDEQVSVDGEDGRLRPDMVVNLPGGRQIVVDSKLSLDAYLSAAAATTDEEREQHMDRHARQVRTHMRSLASKSYWAQFAQAPDFVVMFIPGESFLAAAAQRDPSLFEDAMREHVLIAAPTNFIALLHAGSYWWRQEQLSQNAQEIQNLGRQLYERIRTFAEHFERIRRGLRSATDAYNSAVGSMEARVFPAARRFKDLGAATGDDIGVIEPIDAAPRALTPPEEDNSST